MSQLIAQKAFAKNLFDRHPTFIPTQALYVDLEGRQHGSEDILSLYWPVLPSAARFSWLTRTEGNPLELEHFLHHVETIKAKKAKWIVVFSSGGDSPEERLRLADLFGRDPFPDSEWINLHQILSKSRHTKASIRQNRNVWFCRDRSRVRYSLEALEWEFGIERPSNIRSHSNCYKDMGGMSGQMEVLSMVQRVMNGSASENEELCLSQYCESDVKNMFEIASASEFILFSKLDRRSRRSYRAS